MNLSDLVNQQEIPRGTVLTREQLNGYGLYDTGKKLGDQTVYWGKKGVCILEPLEKDKFTVYLLVSATNN